jgi:hypothetical protein
MSHVEKVRVSMLAAIDTANAKHGAENEMPGLRAAIMAWPDRRLAARLPAEARTFLETKFGGAQHPLRYQQRCRTDL